MKRFNLDEVRGLIYKGSKGVYKAEAGPDLKITILQNKIPTGRPVFNSYKVWVNDKQVGAGSLKDCKIFAGLFLLDLDAVGGVK